MGTRDSRVGEDQTEAGTEASGEVGEARRTKGSGEIKWFLFAAVPLTVFLGLIELNLLISILTHDFMFQTV